MQPQEPPTQPPTRPRKKTPGWATGIAFVVVVGFVIWALANSGGSGGTSPGTATDSPVPLIGAESPTQQAAQPATPAAPAAHTIVYSISGTAKKADVTFTTDGSTSSSQQMGARVPWTTTLSIPDGGLNVYQVSAQNDGSGTITCTITVDGQQVKTVSANGAYAIASCTSP